ncbi:amidohydrolase [Paraliomyxa miuraensis]|uniref:amidohydrolase n=1 Tax=Paraliomyxa miuraensis TaxID=376150 RepID=UPI0022557A58|nr:amidohydrolase [Paraliomyxa miuraensis]
MASGLLALLGLGLGCGPRGSTRAPEEGRAPVAELVLTHGVVYTLDPSRPWAEALAIADGELLAVGTNDAALRHRGLRTRVVDLAGQLVLPGFHDAHVHPVTGGIELSQCDLNGIADREQLRKTVQRCAQQQRGRPWLEGGGWDLTLFPQGNPSRAWLDAIVPDVPVYLSSADGHSAWLNGEALRRAGITADTPDPPHGRIERDADGAPSGVLREDAMELAQEHLPPLRAADYEAGLRRGLAMANRFGITGLHEANGSAEVLAAYESLAAAGELTARVVVAQQLEPSQGAAQFSELQRRRDRIAHPRLRATAVKIFADGVIEAGTAALLRPYEGSESTGTLNLPPEQLHEVVREADARGFDIHVHAIGDRAIRVTLDALEAAMRDNPPRSRRHVIAHLQLFDPADIPRFESLGVIASFQPLWAYADPYIVDLTIPVLGPERSRWLYPIGSVMATGARVVMGSDWSVSSMDPLQGITVALTRRSTGQPPGPAWIPEEVVALEPVLAAYTVQGAYLDRWDDVTGSLVEGKRADLAVLDRNLFEVPPHQIHEARVVTTMLDGEVVYRGEGDRIVGSQR